MTNLLLEGEALMLAPFIGVAIFFVVVISLIVVGAKKADEYRRAHHADSSSATFTDGNGRTQHQRDYINGLRNKAADKKNASHGKTQTGLQKSVTAADGHVHLGDEEERYDEIVGSLGDVDDEGCEEMNGIRLIMHDAAYEGDQQSKDYADLVRAIVLGEVVNNPRFKKHRH